MPESEARITDRGAGGMLHERMKVTRPDEGHRGPSRSRLPAAGLILVSVLLAGCRPGTIPASDGTADTLDAVHHVCRSFLDDEHLPGLSVAILEGDRILFARGYGLADIERRRPVTPETIFPIGSVEKQFTAAAILRLAEEGKLRLEDPITRYLPRLDTGGERVTIADMLNQVSGLQEAHTRKPVDPDESAAAMAGEPWAPVADEAVGEGFSSAEDIGSFAGQPLYFHPRDRFSYSQPNYDLLCYVIAELSGKTYYEVIGDLARTAGIARFHPAWTPRPPDDDPGVAQGYASSDGALRSAWEPNLGSAWTTAVDLARWGRALARGRVISSESYARMITPARLNDGRTWPYGFGVGLPRFEGRPKLMHTGRVLGFYAVLTRYPDDDLTIAIMTNLGGASRIAYDLEPRIARLVLGLDEPEVLDLPLDAAEQARYAGSYDAGAFRFDVVGEGRRIALVMRLADTDGDGEVFDRRPLRSQGHGVFVAEGAPEWSEVRFTQGPGPAQEIAIGRFAQAVRRRGE